MHSNECLNDKVEFAMPMKDDTSTTQKMSTKEQKMKCNAIL